MKYSKTTKLTPAKQRFVDHYSKTDNATESVRRAYPDLVKAGKDNQPYLALKGNRLLRNDNVQLAIMHHKQELTKIATKGIKRIETIIEDSDNDKTALQASMFVVNHSVGTPVQQVQTTSQAIQFNIDLTSSLTE